MGGWAYIIGWESEGRSVSMTVNGLMPYLLSALQTIDATCGFDTVNIDSPEDICQI